MPSFRHDAHEYAHATSCRRLAARTRRRLWIVAAQHQLGQRRNGLRILGTFALVHRELPQKPSATHARIALWQRH
ncbi:hypothetical protein PSAC2689_190087 [Paraburkholderia sacchari]